MTRSPYLRDRLADMPVFRDRERALPMTPRARLSRATGDALPMDTRPPWWAGIRLSDPFAGRTPIGSIELVYDESIPDGVIEIDGTRITLDELLAVTDVP